MLKFIRLLLLIVLTGTVPVVGGTLSPLLDFTLSDGTVRQYRVFVPDNYSSAATVPLVFALHGGGGGGAVTVSSCNAGRTACHPQVRWQDLADANTFLLVYPNSTFSPVENGFNWNDCRSDYDSGVEAADDVRLINELIDRMKTEFPKVDLQRVYATGGSNGGMMTMRIAQELSHRIAAAGTYNASRPADPNNQCRPPLNPIPVVMQNGDQDPNIIYAGGQVGGPVSNRGLTMPVDSAREFWRIFNGASPFSAESPVGIQAANDDGGFYTNIFNRATFTFTNPNGSRSQSSAFSSTAANGAQNSAVYFFRMTNAGHRVASTISTYQLVPPGTTVAEAQASGAENHDFNGIDEIWQSIRVHSLGGPRWIRADIGSWAGNSFIRNANGDFVNTASADGLWTVTSNGTGWETSPDSFHFVHLPTQGAGAVTAKIDSVDSGSSGAIMLRTSLAPVARFVAIGRSGSGIYVWQRRKDGGAVRRVQVASGSNPVWLRVQRAGIAINISLSNDGISFAPVATLGTGISAPIPRLAYFGLAAAGTARFGSVVVSGAQ